LKKKKKTDKGIEVVIGEIENPKNISVTVKGKEYNGNYIYNGLS